VIPRAGVMAAALLPALCATVPDRAGASAAGRALEPAISTRSLLSLKDIGGEAGAMAVSPDGKSVAFQIQTADFAADTYRSAWYVAPISGGEAPVRVGGGGDLMLSPAPFGRLDGARADVQAKWSPDGQWIAYLRKDGDRVQVWRSRVDGTLQEPVTRSDANVLNFTWRPDGAIEFQVGRSPREMARQERDEGQRGYLLDDRFIPDYSTRPLWLRCGGTLWDVPLVRSQQCTPRTWIKESGSPEREASPAETRAYSRLVATERPPGVGADRPIRGIAWNRSHTRVAWLENLSPRTEPGFAAPLTLFAVGRRCAAPQCVGRLEGVWWHNTSVVFLRYEGWAQSVPALYVWDPGSGPPRRIYAIDGTLRSCEMAGERLACLQETPTTPRKIVSIGLQDGQVETVFDPNPGFARYELGRVEKLEVDDGFGNQAFGHLVYPPDFVAGHRYPLVIVQYRSRGFLRGGVGNEYPIYPLAATGFLVYSSDNPEDQRLEARYDTSRWQGLAALGAEDIGAGGYRMRSALGALNAVIDRLESRGIVDGSRIGITGLSGGAEVLYFALIHSRRFAAAATSGVNSPDAYALQVNDTVRALIEGTWDARSRAGAVRNASRVLSLAHNVSRVTTPLLIQVSDRELISVLPDYVALRDAGKPVEAYVFPDELHIKFHPLHKLAIGERVIDWFRFWLKGEEDPAPEKAQQYARWRELRRRESAEPLAGASESSGAPAATPSSDPGLGRDARQEGR
jgi:dipeptidyl aminopeptidase/acylaminoacyl peptidase